jgi:hypothetical protein
MIAIYLSIIVILIGFFVVQRHKKVNVSTTSQCSICHKVFNEDEILTADEMPFCQDHYYLYIHNEWEPIQEVKSTPEATEEGVKLYEYKLHLFHDEGIPTVIKSSYALNGDIISTKLTLFALKDDLKKIKKGLVN